MPNTSATKDLRHCGRLGQIPIYLGKQLRSFIYLSDWKVLPIAAIIAYLVSMVIKDRMFINMDGTLMGAFAFCCVAIWNGCFNSVQVICRERPIVKREHRSGMHISSYIFSHMVYQAMLCLAQTALTMYICKMCGVRFPKEGFMTKWMILDVGISMFLITYASDMLSLLVSALSKTTTAAMTVMPFLLIFQLVFSGGFFALPDWAISLSNLTISKFGLTAITAQSGYNELPMAAGWNQLLKIEEEDLNVNFKVGDVFDKLQQDDNPIIHSIREREIREEDINGALINILTKGGLPAELLDLGVESETSTSMTVGELVDMLVEDPGMQPYRDNVIEFKFTIKQLIDLFGEERVRTAVEDKMSKASQKDIYERTTGNVVNCWITLGVFALLYALLAMIVLEFIDKDKR